jgi:alkylation response protein AidB-like acyl-CoA dehydrogenase
VHPAQPSVEAFAAEAARWLDANAKRRPAGEGGTPEIRWGEGRFSAAVFHALTDERERHLLDDLMGWNRQRAERGYHAVTWPAEYGGLALTKDHARAYAELERAFVVPARHETFSVTTGLVAPTVERFGTAEQKERFVAPLLRTDFLCCQLFSEPGAGSDLAALACRATRDGDEWVLAGQKVWSSGARFSEWGLLIARSDPEVPKHKGLTAFLVPMDADGLEIRPIKQMSGGASFNEVFLDGVRIPDSLRLGDVGDGWNVALTTLGFERDQSSRSGGGSRPGGSWTQLLATARAFGRTEDPVVREQLARVYTRTRVHELINQRVADLRTAGAVPGPEGSIGKLYWTENLRLIGEVVAQILGPRLLADTGEWGTYGWAEHLLGAPGYRIAGGSDEIQRNIIGERVLGLPGEPRVDKDLAWKDVPR